MKIESKNPFNILSQLKFEDKDYESDISDNALEVNENIKDYAGFNVRLWLEKKHRNGKAVTLITGIDMSTENLKDIAKRIKSRLGVGGSVSEQTILIQSQNRDEILKLLRAEGFYNIKKAGG